MKSFYTSVVRYGNSMLYRGYDANGNKIFKKDHFKPTFYISSKKDVGWTVVQLPEVIQFLAMKHTHWTFTPETP